MRLVKQQLAALSSKASTNPASVEKDKPSKAQLKKKGRKQKKESAKTVKKKKQSTVGLSGAEIKKHNLEYLKTSQPADKSVDLMNKVGAPSMLVSCNMHTVFLQSWPMSPYHGLIGFLCLDCSMSALFKHLTEPYHPSPCRLFSHILPAEVATPAAFSREYKGKTGQLSMLSGQSTCGMLGHARHADDCSFSQPGIGHKAVAAHQPRMFLSGHGPCMSASVGSVRYMGSLASCSPHSTQAHLTPAQRHRLCGQTNTFRTRWPLAKPLGASDLTLQCLAGRCNLRQVAQGTSARRLRLASARGVSSSHAFQAQRSETRGNAGSARARSHTNLSLASHAGPLRLPSNAGPAWGRHPEGSHARGCVAALAGGNSLMDVFQAIQMQMQGMAPSDEPPLADVEVSQMIFHPPGAHVICTCCLMTVYAAIVEGMAHCVYFGAAIRNIAA